MSRNTNDHTFILEGSPRNLKEEKGYTCLPAAKAVEAPQTRKRVTFAPETQLKHKNGAKTGRGAQLGLIGSDCEDSDEEYVPHVRTRNSRNSSQSEIGNEYQNFQNKLKKPINKKEKTTKKSKVSVKKSYQNFEFFFTRTLFRQHTNFFKEHFKPYFANYQNETQTLEECLVAFCGDFMPGLLESMPDHSYFLKILQQIVFCHRSEKGEEITRGLPLDFDVLRNPMYRYSKAAVDAFMDAAPELTFVLAWFCQSAKGRAYVLDNAKMSKIENSGEFQLKSADALFDHAVQKLQDHPILLKYL